MPPALVVLLFTLPALLAATAGGVVAVHRPPSPKVTSAIQHLGAGIVFAATALELLPKERTEAAIPVIIGFALGIAVMLGLRMLERKLEARSGGAGGFPTGLLLVTALDFAIDGLVLGMAFAAGEKSGILLAVALTLEVLFVALSVTTEVAGSGVRRLLAVATAPGLALVLCTAAVAGRLFFGSLSPFPFAVLLGVGIVAMLYLVTEELLVEAHEVEETHWSVAAFFLGFLLFLVIEMLVES
jgi:ZIP family zinc transporter